VGHWTADQVTLNDGAPVASWVDAVSGIAATAQGTPTLKTNGAGGRSFVSFDSVEKDAFRVRASQNPLAAATDFAAVVAFVTSAQDLRGTDGPWFQNTGLVDSSASGFSYDWGVSLNSQGKLSAGLGSGFGQPSKTLYSNVTGLNDGKVHVALVTHVGSTLTIRVDDQPAVQRTDTSANGRSPLDLTMGILGDGTGAFGGQIGQVRLYKGAMTEAEGTAILTELRRYYNNEAPLTRADEYVLNEDASLFAVSEAQGLLKNDFDADGDPLTAVVVSNPANGQLIPNPNGSFVYIPQKNFNGTDSFTYAAKDSRLGNVATVTLRVQPIYDPPVAVNDAYKTVPNQVFSVPANQGVLVNDQNVDNVEISAVLDQTVTSGTLVLNKDGSFQYSPGAFAGVASFTYRVSDGQNLSAPATVTLTVNTIPVVRDDSYTIDEDQVLTVPKPGVLANDVDAEGSPLSVELGTGTSRGVLQLNVDGSFTYSPQAHFNGEDSFTYRVRDGIDVSTEATVRLTVRSVNDLPVGLPDVYVAATSPLQVSAANGVLRNDTDADGTPLTATLVDGPQSGTLVLRPDGSFDYTPNPGFQGQDRFRYRASDGQVSTDPVEVTLVVPGEVSTDIDHRSDSVVTFNEIMYNPAGATDTRLEWIELHNQNTIRLDISGWSLAGAVEYQFPEGTVVPSNGFLLVAVDPAALQADLGIGGALGPYVGSLNNAGEELVLVNNSNRVMDILDYDDRGDWPVGPDGSGATLAKTSRHLPSDEASSWSASVQVGGTPGQENFPAGQPSASALLLNEISGVADANFRVELVNAGTAALPLVGYRIAGGDHDTGGFTFGDTVLPTGGYITVDKTQLGFAPVDGEAIFLFAPGGKSLADAQVVKGKLQGRHPQMDNRWLSPQQATFGTANQFAIDSNIVINEVHYHAPAFYVSELDKIFENGEEWIELYNRSKTATVDLGKWQLSDAVGYQFPVGTTLAPESYLVVAKDPTALVASRPALKGQRVLGPFSGALSNRDENIRLLDAVGNPVDEVHYYSAGRWPGEPDALAASLELRDPFSDNSIPESWAASDESGKGGWQTIRVRGLGAGVASDPTQYNEFLMGLLDDGVVLIDDVSVIENPDAPTSRQLIQNGTFDADTLGAAPAKWRIIGTQHGSVVVDPGNPQNQVLRIEASGPTEHMHNNAGTTLKSGDTYVKLSNTMTYEVSFKARWVSGSNQLNSRLYFNRLGTVTRLERPLSVGTPGAANSQRVANLGPTYEGLRHAPLIPLPTDSVTVSVAAADPQGVQSMELVYTVSGGAVERLPMTLNADGRYAAVIPPQAQASIVQFYVEGRDAQGATSQFPAAGPSSRALYRVDSTTLPEDPRHVFRIVMTTADTKFLHTSTNVMSNDRMGATVVYNGEVFYDVGVRLKGSQRGRNTAVRVGYNVSFDPMQLFRGVHSTVGVDRSGSGDEYSQEEIIVRQILIHAGDLPQLYDDLIHVVAPDSRFTGSAMLSTARYNDIFLDNQYENGSAGTAFEYELIYFPTTTSGGIEGLKNPNPDDVRGVAMNDQGVGKERYRWHWLLKNNSRQDDYSQIMAALKVLGKRQTDPGFMDQLEAVVDVDQWLRSFAVTNLAGIGDNYTSGAQHNGIFYVRPSDQRLLYLPWDMDFSFTQSATGPLIENADLRKFLSKPEYEHAFYGHVWDIVNTTFNANYMNPWIDHFDALVPGQPFFSSFKGYINTRSNYAKGRVAAAIPQVPFAITTTGPLDVGNALQATISGTGWVDVREIRLKGSETPLKPKWLTKSSWEVTVPVNPGTQQVTFAAYDFQGKPVGETAITVNSSAVTPVRDFLRVSEINYNPADPSGVEPNVDNDQFEFIELTNTGSVPLDLKGVQFIQVDNQGTLEGIRFTMGAQVLAPQASIVVPRDRAAFQARYGAAVPLATGTGDAGVVDAFSGQLDNGGEKLTLVDASGGIIQQFTFDDAWYPSTDGDGYTLEVLRPGSGDAASWSSKDGWWASAQKNGTPGGGHALPGDSNLDGAFNSSDLVLAFQGGKYEDNQTGNTSWADGDWNRDGEFTTQDLVFVFAWGGYQSGAATRPVTEPLANPVLAALAVDAIFEDDDEEA
jgi:hypothetical protein